MGGLDRSILSHREEHAFFSTFSRRKLRESSEERTCVSLDPTGATKAHHIPPTQRKYERFLANLALMSELVRLWKCPSLYQICFLKSEAFIFSQTFTIMVGFLWELQLFWCHKIYPSICQNHHDIQPDTWQTPAGRGEQSLMSKTSYKKGAMG